MLFDEVKLKSMIRDLTETAKTVTIKQ